MLRIAFALILISASAADEPLWAGADPCRTAMELAAASANYKALAQSLESVAASFEAAEKVYFDRFESEKNLTFSGTVAEFRWTNPRVRMMLNSTENWTIEMSGPAGLARQGWCPKTLTPGMLIIVVIHPLRDGSNGGYLLSATLPDGTQLSGGLGGTYRSGRCSVWIKVRNPASIAVQREHG